MPTNYKTTTKNGVTTVYQESATIPGNYDTVVSSLPSNAVPAQIGGRNLVPFAREAKRVFNPDQFGLNKYYSPTFKFSVDFGAQFTRAQRLAQGVNMFNDYVVGEANRT